MRHKFKQVYKTFTVKPTKTQKHDLETFLSENYSRMKRKIKHAIRSFKYVKCQLSVKVTLRKFRPEEKDYISISPYFTTEVKNLVAKGNIKSLLQNMTKEIIARLENFVRNGSNWQLKKIKNLIITVVKTTPFSGGNNSKLPTYLKNKKCLLNINCPEKLCFLYAVAAGIANKKSNVSRHEQYKETVNSFKLGSIKFPLKVEEINVFESLNNSVSINCFGIEKDGYLPDVLYMSSEHNRETHVNLLLYNDHYYLIRNLSRLLSIHGGSHQGKSFFCNTCLIRKKSLQELTKHQESCTQHGCTQIRQTPEESNKWLFFKNHEKKFLAPFVIYMDFETYQCKNVLKKPSGKTKYITVHKPIAVGLKRVCTYNHTFDGDVIVHKGEDTAEVAIDLLLEEREKIQDILDNERYPMSVSPHIDAIVQTTKKCYICQKVFEKGEKKYRDHMHLQPPTVTSENKLGNVVGISCNTCNLKYSAISNKANIVVFTHNAKNYDFRLIIRQLVRRTKYCKQFSVLPKTGETFTCMRFENLQFLDSFCFLSDSLANLVNVLKQKNEKLETLFQHTRQLYRNNEMFEKFLQKGFFPFEYLSSPAVLQESHLPKRDCFYSSLSKRTISREEYSHAKQMFKLLKCKNLGEYLLAYLRNDVTLLADVMENFRHNCYRTYKLDIAKYVSLPGYAFDSMLLLTGVQLELLTEVEQYDFIQSSIKGGICSQYKKYAKANDPDLMEDFDPEKPVSFLAFLDCNSLYAYSLKKRLPVKGFRWLTQEEIDDFSLEKVKSKSSVSFILECDLEYPKEKHEEHSGFPLAPEKRRIKYEDLSDYNKEVLQKSGLRHLTNNSEKLVQTLYDKSNYVLHVELLKLYIKLGLKLKKIHKVLRFEQKAFMRPFINLNLRMRKQAESKFEQMIYKLLTNAVFGRTLLRVSKHRRVELVDKPKDLLRLTKKSTFHKIDLISPDIASVEMKYGTVTLNSPIYLGMTVLDLSKCVMYQFLYVFLRKKFGKWYEIIPIYSDTDSLLIHMVSKQSTEQTQNIMQVFSLNSKYFDFSNFPKQNPLYSTKNKGKCGYFKLEYGDLFLKEVVALKPKQYSILTTCDDVHRSKGLPKAACSELTHRDYLNTLKTSKVLQKEFSGIRSVKHHLYTVNTKKIGLSPFDDKRFMLDSIHSLAYGDYRIPKNHGKS